MSSVDFYLFVMSTTSTLHSYLDTNLITVQSNVTSSKKLLEEMARLLTIPLHKETREKDIYHCLLEREKLGNTGIGNGVALPHSRSMHATTAVIAIITLEKPIDYNSIDRQPIDVAFGLLVPEDATQEHLNLLADIARIVSNNDNKVALSSAQSAQQVIDLIKQCSAD